MISDVYSLLDPEQKKEWKKMFPELKVGYTRLHRMIGGYYYPGSSEGKDSKLGAICFLPQCVGSAATIYPCDCHELNKTQEHLIKKR